MCVVASPISTYASRRKASATGAAVGKRSVMVPGRLRRGMRWRRKSALIGDFGWSGTSGEAFGASGPGGVQGGLPGVVDRAGRCRSAPKPLCAIRSRGMPVYVVVLGEESVGEFAGLDQATERGREVVQVLQRLELRLGIGIVV